MGQDLARGRAAALIRMVAVPVLVLLAGLFIAVRLLTLEPEPDLSYLPVYPGATSLVDKAGPAEQKQGEEALLRELAFLTGDSAEKVLAFYNQDMSRAGWVSQGSTVVAGTTSVSFTYEEKTPGFNRQPLALNTVKVVTGPGEGGKLRVTVSQYRRRY